VLPQHGTARHGTVISLLSALQHRRIVTESLGLGLGLETGAGAAHDMT
jgi:hypothetical protein